MSARKALVLLVTLLCQATAKGELDRAAQDTLTDLLWKENSDLADAAWKTKYIQGIASGTLDPRNFGNYTVQDAAYCSANTDNLKFLMDKTGNESLKTFFESQYEEFRNETESLYNQWSLKPGGSDLGAAAKWYVDVEYKVAHEEDPLYYLVAMIPCYRLWPYLANKMQAEGDDKASNIYKFWIEEYGSFKSAEGVESEVNKASALIDHQKASQIYHSCMVGEVNFFRSVCDEELLPFPKRTRAPTPLHIRGRKLNIQGFEVLNYIKK
ncbi:uncharacterized protein [Branchiostoma lanceolatum]|uniref:uncharacterized protein isoform X2 n=1 Tax=Branchiostoma lanceolatum TaxID=7740 RepID=UPI0034526702